MKIIAAITAGAILAAATPAVAQTTDVTGTVNMTGSVGTRCIVLPNAGNTFGTTVDFGELAQADGTLRTDLATAFGTIGGAGLEARVVCTTPNPTISVDATPLATTATADAGYDNSIDFLAHVLVDTTTATDVEFTNDSSAAAGAAVPIGGRLANNGGNNISITADNFRTDTAGDLLVASPTYTGQIQVVISPGA